MNTTSSLKRFSWGDKVLHDEYGEGLIICNQHIGLVEVYFKNLRKSILFKEEDTTIKCMEGEF